MLPNHFHLILRIKDSEYLPENYKNNETKIYQPFSNLFNAYAKAFNKQQQRTGSLFQKSPKRILIKDENYLRNLIIYVNINSTHHNILDYKKYKYSSYNALISNKLTLLKREEVINLFDSVENFKYVLKSKKINIELIRELLLE